MFTRLASGSEHSANFNEFVSSNDEKESHVFEGNLIWGKALTGNTKNGLQLFAGSYNYSFYKLGDRVLTIAQDSKSRESVYSGRFARNYSRSEGVPTSTTGSLRSGGFSGKCGSLGG